MRPVDDYTEQMNTDLLAAIDRHAPMRMRRRRLPKADNRWLSTEFMAAKRQKRAYEVRYKAIRLEKNRWAYRASCRRTTKLIKESRANYFCEKLESTAGESRALWITVKKLLHSENMHDDCDGFVAEERATTFGEFFIDKLAKIERKLLKSFNRHYIGYQQSHLPVL
jgi:hypothetical protein